MLQEFVTVLRRAPISVIRNVYRTLLVKAIAMAKFVMTLVAIVLLDCMNLLMGSASQFVEGESFHRDFWKYIKKFVNSRKCDASKGLECVDPQVCQCIDRTMNINGDGTCVKVTTPSPEATISQPMQLLLRIEQFFQSLF